MTRCDHQLQLLFVFNTMKRLFSKWRAPLKRRHRYNGSVHTSPLRKHVPLRGKFRGEQERYRCSLRNESRTSNLPHQRRFSISLRTKSFLEVAQILKFQRSLAWNWSIEEQEDGGEGRHHRRKLSEPHHGFAQIAFPAESGRKRISSGLPGCGEKYRRFVRETTNSARVRASLV